MHIEKKLLELLRMTIQKSKAFEELEEIPEITLVKPKLRKFGDYSSNIALALAQKIGRSSLEIARTIEEAIRKELPSCAILKKIDKIEVKGDGFLNFFLSKNCLYEVLLEITEKRSLSVDLNSARKESYILNLSAPILLVR